jgi:hypothetical protein
VRTRSSRFRFSRPRATPPHNYASCGQLRAPFRRCASRPSWPEAGARLHARERAQRAGLCVLPRCHRKRVVRLLLTHQARTPPLDQGEFCAHWVDRSSADRSGDDRPPAPADARHDAEGDRHAAEVVRAKGRYPAVHLPTGGSEHLMSDGDGRLTFPCAAGRDLARRTPRPRRGRAWVVVPLPCPAVGRQPAEVCRALAAAGRRGARSSSR